MPSRRDNASSPPSSWAFRHSWGGTLGRAETCGSRTATFATLRTRLFAARWEVGGSEDHMPEKTLAEFIEADRVAIVAEWETFARSLTPAANAMNAVALRDHAD